MNKQALLSRVDHTNLNITATLADIRKLCDDAIRYGTATVCIPPSFVKQAVAYVDGKLPICTVIGFPNGYNTTAVKCFEARDAVENGAAEIDMVVNLGLVKEGNFAAVEEEIRAVKEACGDRCLKVIIETCQLTEAEKIALCKAVCDAGADYIKTSTGFSTGGATREDVALLRKHTDPSVKVKAAGGIQSFEDAADMVALGADRLGTSRLVKLMED